jgi:hypothetical protein
LAALGENSVTGWTPRAPIRFYYGSADSEVPPDYSRSAAAAMRQQAIDLGPLEHDPSLIAAVPHILRWIEELQRTEPMP